MWLHTCFVGLQPGGDMAMHYGHWVQVVSAVHAELRKCGDAVQEATSTDSQLAAQQLAASEQFQAYLAGGGPTASLMCRTQVGVLAAMAHTLHVFVSLQGRYLRLMSLAELLVPRRPWVCWMRGWSTHGTAARRLWSSCCPYSLARPRTWPTWLPPTVPPRSWCPTQPPATRPRRLVNATCVYWALGAKGMAVVTVSRRWRLCMRHVATLCRACTLLAAGIMQAASTGGCTEWIARSHPRQRC